MKFHSIKYLTCAYVALLNLGLPASLSLASPQDKLIEAILKQNSEQMASILSNSEFLNKIDFKSISSSGNTLLCEAILSGNVDVFRRILKHCPDPDSYANSNGSSPLMGASFIGNVEMVRELLAWGSNPNFTRASDGLTPLILAASHDRSEVIRELLSHGAKADLLMKNGASAFFIASLEGHSLVVHELKKGKQFDPNFELQVALGSEDNSAILSLLNLLNDDLPLLKQGPLSSDSTILERPLKELSRKSSTVLEEAGSGPRIVFLKQFHWINENLKIEFEKSKAILNQTSKSQFKIAQFILKHPDSVVFPEGCPIDLRTSDILAEEAEIKSALIRDGESPPNIKRTINRFRAGKGLLAGIDSIFTTSFPESFDELSPFQKLVLARYGADRVLLSLGMIQEVKVTSDDSTNSAANNHMNKLFGLRDELERLDPKEDSHKSRIEAVISQMTAHLAQGEEVLMSGRERYVQNKIRDYVKSRPIEDKRLIILVYGANHQFSKYFPAEPPAKIQFEEHNFAN